MKKLLLITLMFAFQSLIGQNNIIKINGVVVDSTNGKALTGTHILLQSKQAGTVTDNNGRFTIITNKSSDALIVSRIGYRTKHILLKKDIPDISITVKLSPDTIMLSEAEIIGRKGIYNRKTNNYTILDYTFADSNILLLQNRLGLKKQLSLTLLNSNFDTIINTAYIPKKADSLFNDCLGNIHLITKDSAYQLWINKTRLLFYKPVELNKFYSFLKDCLLKKESSLFYRKRMLADLGEEIYRYSSKNKKPVLFIKSCDEKKYERYINDILRLSGMYPGHNIPAASVEGDLGLLNSIRSFEIENRFLKDFVYKPIYNKLLSIHDTLVYFNHINSTIDLYYPELALNKTVPIVYQKSKKWKNIILNDIITAKTYTIYYEKGYFDLYEINYQKGSIHKVLRISAFGTYKIRVNNGYVYYLKKDLGKSSSAVRKLYRQRLKEHN